MGRRHAGINKLLCDLLLLLQFKFLKRKKGLVIFEKLDIKCETSSIYHSKSGRVSNIFTLFPA